MLYHTNHTHFSPTQTFSLPGRACLQLYSHSTQAAQLAGPQRMPLPPSFRHSGTKTPVPSPVPLRLLCNSQLHHLRATKKLLSPSWRLPCPGTVQRTSWMFRGEESCSCTLSNTEVSISTKSQSSKSSDTGCKQHYGEI